MRYHGVCGLCYGLVEFEDVAEVVLSFGNINAITTPVEARSTPTIRVTSLLSDVTPAGLTPAGLPGANGASAIASETSKVVAKKADVSMRISSPTRDEVTSHTYPNSKL